MRWALGGSASSTSLHLEWLSSRLMSGVIFSWLCFLISSNNDSFCSLDISSLYLCTNTSRHWCHNTGSFLWSFINLKHNRNKLWEREFSFRWAAEANLVLIGIGCGYQDFSFKNILNQFYCKLYVCMKCGLRAEFSHNDRESSTLWE